MNCELSRLSCTLESEPAAAGTDSSMNCELMLSTNGAAGGFCGDLPPVPAVASQNGFAFCRGQSFNAWK